MPLLTEINFIAFITLRHKGKCSFCQHLVRSRKMVIEMTVLDGLVALQRLQKVQSRSREFLRCLSSSIPRNEL